MSESTRIHVVIYSNASLLQQFEHPELAPKLGNTLIEAALEPTLGPALNFTTPVSFPGISAVSGGQVSLRDLAVQHPRLPHPIVLASGSKVSAEAVSDAIAHLGSVEGLGALTILVHIEHVEVLKYALLFANEISLAWDLADIPQESLPKVVEFLVEEEMLSAESWGGIFPYKAADSAPEAADLQALEGIFKRFVAA